MAIGTPTTIGTNAGTPEPLVLTTTAAVPAGALIILTVGWGSASAITISSVTGGSLTWAVDHSEAYSGIVNWGFAVASAQAPAGLASSSAITVDLSGVAYGMFVGGCYCEGLETTSPGVKDVSDGQGQASATNWDTSATSTTVADTLVIGGCIHDGLQTNTPTGGANEVHDFQFAGESWSMCTEYLVLSATASTSLTGTWTGGAVNCTSAFVAYKGAAAAGQVLQASADSADGNWTDQAGGSSLFAAIDEDTASDSDYIRSELGPQSSGCRVKLEAGGDPAVSTGHEINWRIAKDTASGQTINMTVKLYQGGGNSLGGGTLIADFDRNDVSSSFTDYAETLSGGEADAITDYTDLYLEFWADVP